MCFVSEPNILNKTNIYILWSYGNTTNPNNVGITFRKLLEVVLWGF